MERLNKKLREALKLLIKTHQNKMNSLPSKFIFINSLLKKIITIKIQHYQNSLSSKFDQLSKQMNDIKLLITEEKKNNDDNGVINIPQELRQLTVDEVTSQLRSYGLPIRLFGEKVSNEKNNNDDNNNKNVGDLSRLIRLHAAIQGREATILGISEKDEFLLDSADRTRNVFLEKDAATMSTSNNNGAVAASTPVKSKEQQQLQQQNKEREQQHLTEEERNDKPKRIYRYFKTLIRQWEEDLNTRSESTKHTLAGKNETKTLKQCKDYIRPLFQLCKRRELDESLQNHLFKIVINCDKAVVLLYLV